MPTLLINWSWPAASWTLFGTLLFSRFVRAAIFGSRSPRPSCKGLRPRLERSTDAGTGREGAAPSGGSTTPAFRNCRFRFASVIASVCRVFRSLRLLLCCCFSALACPKTFNCSFRCASFLGFRTLGRAYIGFARRAAACAGDSGSGSTLSNSFLYFARRSSALLSTLWRTS